MCVRASSGVGVLTPTKQGAGSAPETSVPRNLTRNPRTGTDTYYTNSTSLWLLCPVIRLEVHPWHLQSHLITSPIKTREKNKGFSAIFSDVTKSHQTVHTALWRESRSPSLEEPISTGGTSYFCSRFFLSLVLKPVSLIKSTTLFLASWS